nr:hypothetical protein [Tanacetum cinerariifolium]
MHGGGVVSWASKKQTFIIGSTMEYVLVALAAADSEATEVAWTLSISMAMRERTGNVVSFAFQKPKSSKVSNSVV